MHPAAANPVRSTAGQVIQDITLHQKLLNGNTILIIYYVLIITFFLLDRYLVGNAKNMREDLKNGVMIGPFSLLLYRIYLRFRSHNYMIINLALFLICLVLILVTKNVYPREIVAISIWILSFSALIRIFRKVFLGQSNYENFTVTNQIDLIFYILLGTYFCYFVSFLTKPDMTIAYAGLIYALYLCFSIMLKAIFNPHILERRTGKDVIYTSAYGILRGMFALIVLELLVLYMMVYAPFATNAGYYISTSGQRLDAWDMLYYLFVSFSTIGYGDIVPVRPGGSMYSEFTAMVISACAFFSTACFAGAVISSANSIAQNTRSRIKDHIKTQVQPTKNIAATLKEQAKISRKSVTYLPNLFLSLSEQQVEEGEADKSNQKKPTG